MANGPAVAAATGPEVVRKHFTLTQSGTDSFDQLEVSTGLSAGILALARMAYFHLGFNPQDVAGANLGFVFEAAISTKQLTSSTEMHVANNKLLFYEAIAAPVLTSGAGIADCVRRLFPSTLLRTASESLWFAVATTGSGQANTFYGELGYQIVTVTQQQLIQARLDDCC